MTGVFVVIGNIDSLINMFSAIMWLWYGTAVFGVIIMRLTRPHVHRPFEVIKEKRREEGEGREKEGQGKGRVEERKISAREKGRVSRGGT